MKEKHKTEGPKKKEDETRDQTNMKQKLPKWQNKNSWRFRPFLFLNYILILCCKMLFVQQIKHC